MMNKVWISAKHRTILEVILHPIRSSHRHLEWWDCMGFYEHLRAEHCRVIPVMAERRRMLPDSFSKLLNRKLFLTCVIFQAAYLLHSRKEIFNLLKIFLGAISCGSFLKFFLFWFALIRFSLQVVSCFLIFPAGRFRKSLNQRSLLDLQRETE